MGRRQESAACVPPHGLLVRVLGIGRALPHSEAAHTEPPTDAVVATGRDAPPLDFDAFYRSQYPSVVRLSYSLCGSLSVAEDLAQETFITAYRRWQRIRSFDRPDLWVRRVVINRSISHRRRQVSERTAFQRMRARAGDQAMAQFTDDLGHVLADGAVWKAVGELSRRQAKVLALFYVEDQPLSAIAEILGLGEETVKTHLKRGRAALATKLGEASER